MGPPMCDIMTGEGVWITNGDYDGGMTFIFFLKNPPTNIRLNFLIDNLYGNFLCRIFVVLTTSVKELKGVGAFVVTGE